MWPHWRKVGSVRSQGIDKAVGNDVSVEDSGPFSCPWSPNWVSYHFIIKNRVELCQDCLIRNGSSVFNHLLFLPTFTLC